MTLHYSPAYCSLAVHIALRASGQAFSLAKVDTAAARLGDGSDFGAVNPRGRLTGRDGLSGDRFTVADAQAFTIVRWAPMIGMSLKGFPQLEAYLARMEALPAVHAALVAEGLTHA